MDQGFEVSDSTDWLNTPLSPLSQVEIPLRCQVCKDFFDTPMITNCSHTFCSLCIRRALSSDGKCPACRSEEQEHKLRRNWTLQELVESFKQARPSLLQHARTVGNSEKRDTRTSSKRKLSDTELEADEAEDGSQTRKTRTSSRRVTRSQSGTNDWQASSGEAEAEPDDGLIACPICNQRMKEEAVFGHLDICGTSTRPSHSVYQRSHSDPVTKPQQPLPKLHYSILKERDLRRKLIELGIPNWGSKTLMVRRHTEWVNIWNANCDSSRPKPKRELLQDLDVWERAQGGLASNAAGVFNSAKTVMDKDFDSAGWAESHSDDFQQLIANARRKVTALRSTEQSADSSNSRDDKHDTAVSEGLLGRTSEVPPNLADRQPDREAGAMVKDIPVINLEESPVESRSAINGKLVHGGEESGTDLPGVEKVNQYPNVDESGGPPLVDRSAIQHIVDS
ncbi:MAG: E3 ubiquitin-protein ligase rad18 [Cirrosporium novae-zelandiae]|nr:MAG: E3 ubiquitin-protein ligase rad18 [Cirrosporium novae-zelandiae]